MQGGQKDSQGRDGFEAGCGVLKKYLTSGPAPLLSLKEKPQRTDALLDSFPKDTGQAVVHTGLTGSLDCEGGAGG